MTIRQRLRAWKDEHPDDTESLLSDSAELGELCNSYTRPQNVTMASFDVSPPLYNDDELSDLRSSDTQLRPGDMVEMR
jgi:ABC-type nitrate/sulfonate/bicarbonate transport system substrate-binding protein